MSPTSYQTALPRDIFSFCRVVADLPQRDVINEFSHRYVGSQGLFRTFFSVREHAVGHVISVGGWLYSRRPPRTMHGGSPRPLPGPSFVRQCHRLLYEPRDHSEVSSVVNLWADQNAMLLLRTPDLLERRPTTQQCLLQQFLPLVGLASLLALA